MIDTGLTASSLAKMTKLHYEMTARHLKNSGRGDLLARIPAPDYDKMGATAAFLNGEMYAKDSVGGAAGPSFTNALQVPRPVFQLAANKVYKDTVNVEVQGQAGISAACVKTVSAGGGLRITPQDGYASQVTGVQPIVTINNYPIYTAHRTDVVFYEAVESYAASNLDFMGIQQSYALVDVENFIENMAILGDTALNITGQTNNSVYTSTPATTGNWATATSLQIMTDISNALGAIFSASSTAFLGVTIQIDPNAIQYLVQPLASAGVTTSTSIASWIKQNGITAMFGNREVRFIASPLLTGTGIMCITSELFGSLAANDVGDPNNVIIQPMPLTPRSIVNQDDGFRIPYVMRMSGYIPLQAGAGYIVTGIL